MIDVAGLADSAVVQLAVSAQVAENAAQARRLGAYLEIRDRCARDHLVRRANAQQREFVMSPGEETAVEFGAALGLSETTVLADLHVVEELCRVFPRYWAQCMSGRLDVGKAAVLLDAGESIADPADVGRFAALMDEFLDRRDDPDSPLVPFTRTQLQSAARYRKSRFPQKCPEERFCAAFAKRRVRLDLQAGSTAGIGSLACTTAATDLMQADYRLTLIAKQRCQDDPEGRTVEQMRADSLVDLLLGRLTVAASTADLEHDGEAGDVAATFQTHAVVGAWARPVINVTVPITTLMGLSDEAGLLSGDITVPPELVRRIALDPGSTWHRLLTDEAGNMLDLSTKSYQPTEAIARAVVALHRTCLWPTCSRPAVVCELDHRHRHPDGETCVGNLGPFCKRHHRAKHADGFSVRLLEDGRYEFTTKRGTVLYARPSEQPVPEWPDDELIVGPCGRAPDPAVDLLDDLEAELAEIDALAALDESLDILLDDTELEALVAVAGAAVTS